MCSLFHGGNCDTSQSLMKKLTANEYPEMRSIDGTIKLNRLPASQVVIRRKLSLEIANYLGCLFKWVFSGPFRKVATAFDLFRGKVFRNFSDDKLVSCLSSR